MVVTRSNGNCCGRFCYYADVCDANGNIADGCNLSPKGDHEIQVVVTSSMRLVSLAAGGEDDFYDYFVYVGKDKVSTLRRR